MTPVYAELATTNYIATWKQELLLIFEWLGLGLGRLFLATPLGSGKLTSHDLPGHSEIHQGLGPYWPGCIATPLIKATADTSIVLLKLCGMKR